MYVLNTEITVLLLLTLHFASCASFAKHMPGVLSHDMRALLQILAHLTEGLPGAANRTPKLPRLPLDRKLGKV